MNFLYHAAHQVAATNPALSRLYIRNMVVVAQKLVLRMYASPPPPTEHLFIFLKFKILSLFKFRFCATETRR
jgi:hypothetical protein